MTQHIDPSHCSLCDDAWEINKFHSSTFLASLLRYHPSFFNLARAYGRRGGVVSKAPYTVEDRKTAQAIVRYLIKHPKAKDTVDGIAQWWLEGERSKRTNVERAVSLLLSRGVIVESRRKGLPPYYQLNRRRRAAALRILREL